MHIKVRSRSTETSWCLYCMKTVEQKCFAPSNRPRCDLGLPFKERLPSPSNTQEFFHCVGIALKHCIQSPLWIKSSHLCSMWSHLSATHKTKKHSDSKRQQSEWNFNISKIYPYSPFSSLWFIIRHSKSLPPSVIFVLLLSIYLDPCCYCLSEIFIIYSTNPVWVTKEDNI